MLGRVTASEVIREAISGRTKPVLMLCEADTDGAVEVFCKLSAGCFEGVTGLAREVVAACLATDLNLPVPTPNLVEIPWTLASVVTDPDIAERLGASSPVGFGSAKVENQFSVWTSGSRVTDVMLPTALGAFVFDAVIDNADRKPSNPNCLVARDRLHLIDHELAFPSTSGLLGWRPPWQAGALDWLDRPDDHLFCRELKNAISTLVPCEGYGPRYRTIGCWNTSTPYRRNGTQPIRRWWRRWIGFGMQGTIWTA